MGAVDFRLLGAVEVCVDDGPVDLGRAGAAKVRCLLAALAHDPGVPVRSDVLVARVWGTQPPSASLRYKYIAWLRAALAPLGVPLESRSGGYALVVPPERVDVHRFARLAQRSRTGSPADAADTAWRALALWRGPALADLSGEWARTWRDRLDRQRRDTVVTWAKAALALGEHQAVADELSRWHTEHPADEAIAAALMLACHRAGRTGDALAVFQATRSRVRADFAADPGPEIIAVYQRIRHAGTSPERPVEPGYLGQVRRIAPAQLLGRNRELAELAAFCVDPAAEGRYVWWRGPAWSGKSALLSWFVLHPPAGVRIVSFFVTARLANQHDRTAFIDNVLAQLLALLGRQPPPLLTESTREAHLLGLLADAARACRERGDRLVLVVDGLDEDRGVHVGPDWHSIAALLPAAPPARVIVAGRADPPLPADVPAAHPLRAPDVVRTLTASPDATVSRHEAHRELAALLQDDATRDLVGLVTAAGGGLTAADLAELTGSPAWAIDERLRSVAGRAFAGRAGTREPVYLLAHEELQVTAVERLGAARLAEYRRRLADWADRYAAEGWPATTPDHLLSGYHQMLVAEGDVARVVRLASDAARLDRMLAWSHADQVALAEIGTALELCAAARPPDLAAGVRLSRQRDRLWERNSYLPDLLPMVWVRLGEAHRAEALVRAVPDPGHRVAALDRVASAIADTGDTDRAAALLRDAETIVLAMPDPRMRLTPLTTLAAAMSRIGARDHADRLWRDSETAARKPDRRRSESGLAYLVQELAKAGEYDRAEALVGSMTDHDMRAHASVVLAVRRPGADLAVAQRHAESITRSAERSATLRLLAMTLAGRGDREWAEAIARDTRTRGADPVDCVTRMAAGVLARAGDFDAAEATARSIATPSERGYALREVIRALAEAGHHERAVSMARGITDSFEHSMSLCVAVAGMHTDPARAEAVARTIPDVQQRAAALCWVADALATGDREHAAQLLHDAESIVRAITDPYRPELALRQAAIALAHNGEHERAAELAALLPPHAAGAIAEAIAGLPEDRRPKPEPPDAAAARALPDATQRAFALVEAARVTGDPGLVAEARAIPMDDIHPHSRVALLREIGQLVEPDERAVLVAEILRIGSWHQVVPELLALAPQAIDEPIADLVDALRSDM